MKKFAHMMAGAVFALALPLALPFATSPAHAGVETQDPARFIETLSGEGFAALRGGNKAAARAKFRTLLAKHFAVDAIGDRLIRRWAPTISTEQRAAYKAAFPGFIIGTYADRLFDFADADLKVIRTLPAGGGIDVVTQVTRPGAQPIATVWSVRKIGDGWKVTNLKVDGVNLAISQAADFDSIVQRQGFDALVKMMKARS